MTSSAYLILSFCGGGIRGYLSAEMVMNLNSAMGGYGLLPKFYLNADMYAGTSTGSQLVSMLMAKLPILEICNLYATKGVEAFEGPGSDASQPAYQVQHLVTAQQNLHPGSPTLSVLAANNQCDLLCTAFNVGATGTNWTPLLYTNIAVSGIPFVQDTTIVEAAVSSSAMPGMYGSYNSNIDGAFVHHDPTLAAISLAVAKGVPLTDIHAICFGTGFMPNWIASDTSQWGAAQWQSGPTPPNPSDNYPQLLINGGNPPNEGPNPILNASLNGTSTNLIPSLCGMLLGSRYAYLNPQIPYIPENATDPAAIATMKSAAASASYGDAMAVLNGWGWPSGRNNPTKQRA
jgi:patatin-like phospholipase/acyl hydrolase